MMENIAQFIKNHPAQTVFNCLAFLAWLWAIMDDRKTGTK